MPAVGDAPGLGATSFVLFLVSSLRHPIWRGARGGMVGLISGCGVKETISKSQLLDTSLLREPYFSPLEQTISISSDRTTPNCYYKGGY